MMEYALLMLMAVSLLTPVNVTTYSIYLEGDGFRAMCSTDIVQLGNTTLITGIYCRASPPGASSFARRIVGDLIPRVSEEILRNPSGEKIVEVGTSMGTITMRVVWEAGESKEVFIITPLGAGLLGGVAGAVIAGAFLTLRERRKYDLTAPPYEPS